MFRVVVVSGLLCSAQLSGADFTQFRGSFGNGVAVDSEPPTTWGIDKNLKWMTALPGSGWSQPVVVGQTVFMTAAVSDGLSRPKNMEAGVKDPSSMPFASAARKPADIEIEWQLLAVDAETGKIRWKKTVCQGKPRYAVHPSNTYATETVCADAERVYAYFGATGTLAAFDHAGKEIWKVELGVFPVTNSFGSGSSPALFNGTIFIANFNETKGFIAAFQAATGKEIWRENRDKPGSAWATPFVWRNSQRTEIVACGDKLVTSHDPETGKELWRLAGIDTAFASSPAAEGDTLLLAASSPFSASPIYGVKAGAVGPISLGKGETSNQSIAWHRNGSGVGMSSPVAVNGYLYIPGQSSLICVDIKTGEQKYKERLPKMRNVTASAVAAGGKVLVLDEAGRAAWVKTGPHFEIVDTAEIKDTFWATPALAGNSIYLRGVDALYCVKQP